MEDKAFQTLVRLCAETAQTPAPGRATAAAADIRGLYGDAVVGMLFYGSCLRAGDDRDKILDFYVLVDNYRAAYGRVLPALWNRLLPPNVYYRETPASSGVIRSKYAVISLDQFERFSQAFADLTIWARFSQPARLVWRRDADTAARIHRALARSVVTMLAAVAPMMPPRFSAAEIWQAAFAATYRAELRAERSNRPAELFSRDVAWYEALTLPALRAAGYGVDGPDAAGHYQVDRNGIGRRRARLEWLVRRICGKLLSLARLIKAGFTFAGGADYLAWKIARHSGVAVELSPWQRRHPVAAGLILFWRLWRQGAFH